MRKVGFILIALLLSASPTRAEPLQWAAVHWPPWMILQGPDTGKGVIDGLMRQMAHYLPHYEHEQVEMNWQRFWLELSKGTKICSMMSLKTPAREEIAYFSLPSGVYQQLALIVRTQDWPKWDSAKTISLVDMLKTQSFEGLVESSRAYGPLIDGLLASGQGGGLKRNAQSPSAIMQMLQRGRIDYTIEFPAVAAYLDAKSDHQTGVTSLSIREMPKYGVSYIACPKNTWGKRVVEQVNQVILGITKSPELLDKLLAQHHSPEEVAALKAFYFSRMTQP